MKYLICGLGNIGKEYKDTRHNIGFNILDHFAESKNFTFQPGRYGDLLKLKYKGRILLLLKPNTFMNLSGKAVKFWLKKEKIKIENSLIIADDINLNLGKIRLRNKGGDGGHNGLKSVESELNTTNYPRLRIGIGNDFAEGRQVDHVLGKFSNEELEQVQSVTPNSIACIMSFVSIGLTRTMNSYN